MRERLATFISGTGSTMEEIIKASQSGELPIDIGCVVVSSYLAHGIEKARKLGIPQEDILIVPPGNFKNSDGKVDREKYGQHIVRQLEDRGVTVITQNGWLPLTPEVIIKRYSGRIFNQHPGPVPEFGGKGMFGRRVHAAILLFHRIEQRENPWTEAIAQHVAVQYDEGGVVKSERVDILADDTVESLGERVKQAEHRVQIALLHDVASGNLQEIQREALLSSDEEDSLRKAKEMAILLYPKG